MIRFAIISRARDGLALSASTDIDNGLELRESKKYAKLLSKKARLFQNRCFIRVGTFCLYALTERDVCFLTICEQNYAAVLAYSFLDEVQKEFLAQYSKQVVDKVLRPYSFIEFDNSIQKCKQRYNNTRTLTTRLDLAEMNDELKKSPPFEVTEFDLGLPNDAYKFVGPATTSVARIPSISWTGLVVFALSCFCAALNLIRVVPFISEHGHDPDEEGHWWIYTLSLLSSGCLNIFQGYGILYPLKIKSWMSWACCICNVFLIIILHHIRNIFQIMFHLAVTVSVAYVTDKRLVSQKPPDLNV